MSRWSIALAAVSAAGSLLAQEGRPMPLSLGKAVEIAAAPNGATRLQLAAELAEQAEARRRQALGVLLPNVAGSYTFRSFTNNIAAIGIEFPKVPGLAIPALLGPVETNDIRASASQSLFDLSAIRRYQAATAQARAARSDGEAARNQVKGTAARAYLNAVRSEAALETARANVALAERIVRLARSQKEAGTGTGIEITRGEVTLAAEKQRLIAAAEEHTAAVLELLRVMNLDLDIVPELTDKLRYVPAEVPAPASAVAAARELRPELKAQAERERAARLNGESARWERLPSATAFGDYGALGKAGELTLPTRSAGISVRIPVWDGGRTDARRAEAASQQRMESIRTRDTARQVELEIRLAVEALKSSENQVAVAREALTQAEKELAQAERRVTAGVAGGLEITDAQARLARAREGDVSAVFRQQAARIALGVAVGNIDMVLQ